MSESSATIIKILAALTSTKASIKYLSVAVVLTIAWTQLNTQVRAFGAPEEHVSLIMILISVGVGSIFGELVYFCFNKLFSSFTNSKKLKEAEKQKTIASTKLKAATEKTNEELINTFDKVFSMLDSVAIDSLVKIVANDNKFVLNGGWVEKLLHFKICIQIGGNLNNDKMVYINPAIYDKVIEALKIHAKEKIDEFFKYDSDEKKLLIKLFDKETSEVEFNLLAKHVQHPFNHYLYPVFSSTEIKRFGYKIHLREPYKTEMEKATKLTLHSDIGIKT